MSAPEHPLLKRFINYYKKNKQVKLCYSEISIGALMSSIIAPFYTISASMQLSVRPHLNLYSDSAPVTKTKESRALIKQITDVTLRDIKNFNLIKSSGMPEGQKPYRAPIYLTYRECIKSLWKQGILGFYKGNFIRLISTGMIMRLKISLEWFLIEHFSFRERSMSTVFLGNILLDLLCHPFYVIESRFILQNRLPQFRIFPSLIKYRNRSLDDAFVAVLCQIPKNIILLLTTYSYSSISIEKMFVTNVLLSQTLLYPILTCMRRLVCQSEHFPGLLPIRYLNLLHALSLIRREEGLFRGLYRGYLAHMIAVSIYGLTVPIFARVTVLQKLESEDLFENDEIFKEIQRRKIEEINKQNQK